MSCSGKRFKTGIRKSFHCGGQQLEYTGILSPYNSYDSDIGEAWKEKSHTLVDSPCLKWRQTVPLAVSHSAVKYISPFLCAIQTHVIRRIVQKLVVATDLKVSCHIKDDVFICFKKTAF